MAQKKVTKKKRGGGPKTKATKDKLMKELRAMVVRGDHHRMTRNQLAEQFKVTPQTIYDWIDDIYESMPPEKVENIFYEIKTTLVSMKRRQVDIWRRAIAEDNLPLELKMMEEIRKTMAQITKTLEDFHVKPKAIDWQVTKEMDGEITEQWLLELEKEDD